MSDDGHRYTFGPPAKGWPTFEPKPDPLDRVLDTLEALLIKGEKNFNAPMVNDVPDDVLELLNERRERRRKKL
jgi:hypothetical protein